MMSAIITFAKWQVKSGKLDTVLALLSELAPRSREEKGNLFYQVFQSNTDPNVIVLSESYSDDDALTLHRNSEHFQQIVIQQIVPLLENREVVITTALDLDNGDRIAVRDK